MYHKFTTMLLHSLSTIINRDVFKTLFAVSSKLGIIHGNNLISKLPYSNLSNQSSELKPDSEQHVFNYLDFSESCDEFTKDSIKCDVVVYNDFLSESEEQSLVKELEPYMKRLRYEFDHWDDAIHGFRETERLKWNEYNTKIIDRVKNLAFPNAIKTLLLTHVLDLAEEGYIKPHIDSVRFCGNIISGLSLLSDSVMRLVHDKEKDKFVDILLKRRSLYILKDSARYDYTHEILANKISIFKNNAVNKTRRISVICRNEPKKEDTD